MLTQPDQRVFEVFHNGVSYEVEVSWHEAHSLMHRETWAPAIETVWEVMEDGTSVEVNLSDADLKVIRRNVYDQAAR